ncbi:MAG: right-handed parallel beta-helix repeat-containing protein [Elusimicrobiota bacterium]
MFGDSNTISQSYVFSSANYGAVLETSAQFDTITGSTMTSGENGGDALYFNSSSSNTITLSEAVDLSGSGAYLAANSNGNTISVSTLNAVGSSYFGLYLTQASSNTFEQDYVGNPTGYGVYLTVNSIGNTVSLSTMSTGGASNALNFSAGSDGNLISQAYMFGGASGRALSISNVSYNTIVESTMTANSSLQAVYMYQASSISISQSYVANPSGLGVEEFYSNGNSISLSTITGGASSSYALYLQQSSSNTFSGDFVQGSTAVYVSGSTGTVIGGSTLLAQSANGSALQMDTGSDNLTLSSSVLTAQSGGAAVYLDQDVGSIYLSTNTLSGAEYGVFAATLAAGTQLWITSNTIVPGMSASVNTYGLFFDGLPTGATVENNTIAYRGHGSISNETSYAVYAASSTGLQIDHNRIDEPGNITAGSFVGLDFVDVNGSAFKFNDMNSTGTGFTNAYLIQLSNYSGSLVFTNNVLLSSFGVTGSSQTIMTDGTVGTIVSDYNDYFSSNGVVSFSPSPSVQAKGLKGWQKATGFDGQSISSDPLWYNVGSGVEDFHPMTGANNGRYFGNGYSGTDTATSLTIDSGDPGESYGNEPPNNGGRVNQGSYGNTNQASLSNPLGLFPGCVANTRVGAGQSFATITSALSALTPLASGKSCVIIEDGETYPEQVTVANFILNTSSIAIFADPFQTQTPAVNPPAGFAAFSITNASVSLSGINIVPTNGITYGVFISSSYVQISSINIQDAGGSINTAANVASSYTAISYSSITAKNADGLEVYGIGAAVSYSTAVINSSVATDYPILLNGSSSGTYTGIFASNPSGNGVNLSAANYNTITQSTMTANTGTAFNNVTFTGSSSNTISGSYIQNAGGGGLILQFGSNYNTVSGSTMTNLGDNGVVYLANGAGASYNIFTQDTIQSGSGSMLLAVGAHNRISSSTIASNSGAAALGIQTSSNSVSLCLISNAGGGHGLELSSNADYNTIILSTMTSSSGGSYGLELTVASSNIVTQSYIFSSGGSAADLDAGATGNTISMSTIASSYNDGGTYGLNNDYGLFLNGASSNTISGDLINVPSYGLYFNGANFNTISQTTVSVTYAGWYGLWMSNSSSNTLIQSPVLSPYGAWLASANNNTITGGVITANGNGTALFASGSSSNTISQTYINNAGQTAVYLSGASNGNTISQSSMTVGFESAGPYYGLEINASSSNTFVGDYIQDSTAVWVTGSTGTVISGSVLAAGYSGGFALQLDGGSSGLNLSGSALSALSDGAGVYLGAGDSGLIILSTNSLTGAEYGVYAASVTAGSQLWITSNTIVPGISAGNNTYGLYLAGLPSGATVENNTVVYRTPGPMSGQTSYALYASSAVGLQIDHNRFDEPGSISAGSYVGVDFIDVTGSSFKFNDVNSTGTAFTNAYLLAMTNGSGNLIVRDNIFVSSFAVVGAGSSATFVSDGTAGYVATDYNDFYSSNSVLTFMPNPTTTVQGLAAWQQFSSNDVHSISSNPLWFNVAAGAEDFHPMSQAGRFLPGGGAAVDGATSFTIDAGDPTESYTNEVSPNGLRVNQGSYGDTNQASKTAPLPGYPGCAQTNYVGAGPYYTSINNALNAFSHTLPSGETCVVIEDGETYLEQVTVANFAFAVPGSSIAIFADPATHLTPTVDPPGGFAAFSITNASVSISGINIVPTIGISYGVFISSAYVSISSVNVIDPGGNVGTAGIVASYWTSVNFSSLTLGAANVTGFLLQGSSNTAVSYSTAVVNGSAYRSLWMNGASSNTISNDYLSMNSINGVAAFIQNSDYNTFSQSTMASASAGGAGVGLYLLGSSSNKILNDSISSTFAQGLLLAGGSDLNTISQSTITSSGSGAGPFYALLVNGFSDSNTITQSYINDPFGYGAVLTNAGYNTISQSTITSNSSYAALYLNLNDSVDAASSNTVSQSYLANPLGYGAYLNGVADGNTIVGSTISAGSSSDPALVLNGAEWNLISQSVVICPQGTAVWLEAGADGNTISRSTMTAPVAGAHALYFQGVSGDIAEWSFMSNASGNAVTMDGASYFNTISLSTMIGTSAAYPALLINGSTNSIVGDYVQGSTAIWVSQSTGTVIGGSVLVATNTAGSALQMDGGSIGLWLSSSVLTSGPSGAAVYLGAGDGGPIFLSTNSLSGAAYGVYAATITPGTQLWIASNTIIPSVVSGINTYGLFFDGLASGATVENNTVAYRTPNANTGSAASYALYAQSSSGLQIDHNRFNEPGMIVAGSFVGAGFENVTNTAFKFNDVNSIGTGFTNAYLLEATDASNVEVRDNVFMSSFGVSGVTATMLIDAGSEGGFSANFNDYYSSSTLQFLWGGTLYGPLSSWQSETGLDGQSLSSNPLWYNVAAGVEDFHPMSRGGGPGSGRYDPVAGAFVQDGATSLTIDSGDPLESYVNEPSPNGSRVNQGSYGDTAQASESFVRGNFGGCSTTTYVGAGMPFGTITAGVNALAAAILSHPGGMGCVVIEDGATYPEQVTVANIGVNISSVSIFPDPIMGLTPTVDPPAGFAAFSITNASVSISGINIVPTNSISYGVFVSSKYVSISSVNVIDPNGSITTAGIVASSWTTVSYTSVTLGNTNASGYFLSGSTMTTVSYSSAAVNDNVFNDVNAAIALTGGGSNKIAHSFFSNKGYCPVGLLDYSNDNTILLSTFTSMSSLSHQSVLVRLGSSNTITQSYVSVVPGSGYAMYIYGISNGNTLSQSTMTAGGAGQAALFLQNAASNTVTGNLISNPGGYGAWLDVGAQGNTISASTITAGSGSAGIGVVYLSQASSNTITQSYVANPTGYGAYFDSGSNFNTISLTTMTINNGSDAALFLIGNSSNFISQSYFANGGAGYGALLDTNSNSNTISQSMITSGGSGYALDLAGASSNTINQTFISNAAGHGLYLFPGSNFNTVLQSTMTGGGAGNFGLSLSNVIANTFEGDYIQGSTAAYITQSTGTVIGGSVLVATNTAGSALQMDGGSQGLSLSSSVLTAGSAGAAVYLGAGDGGAIILSTNSLSGAAYGVYAATTTGLSQLWITSSTILPAVTSANNTYGIYLDGLTNGATIESNSIFYQTPGSMGVKKSYGLFVQSSAGLQIDHNEINEPGMITGGTFYGAYLSNATDLTFKFNDVYSSAPAGVSAFLLRAGELSGQLTMRDNIFVSSFTKPGVGFSSATLAFPGSQIGFNADYNDYFSSNSALSFVWGAAPLQGLAAWQSATSGDGQSLSANPLWAGVFAGAEDFHPMSVSGRYLPCGGTGSCGTVQDGYTSPTIDSGDPAESYDNEQSPNGERVNQGSYGNTVEASETFVQAAYPGCAQTNRVGDGEQYATISAAVNGLSPLQPGLNCVSIEDGETYPEQVTVAGFTMTGSSIAIFADPNSGERPIVDPPAGFAAFSITNASVSVSGIDIVPTNSLSYGVFVSSKLVTISSVNVIDPAGWIIYAGVMTSSRTTVSYTSVTVGGLGASAFWLPGSTLTAVSYSSAASVNGTTPGYALWINGASSNTFTSVLANSPTGTAVYMDNNSIRNLITQSTMTSAAGTGLELVGASSDTISQSIVSGAIYAVSLLDAARILISQTYVVSGSVGLFGSSYNTISQSTVTTSNAALGALYLNNSSTNTFKQSYFSNDAGDGADLEAESIGNTITLSTMDSPGTDGTGATLYLLQSSSNTILGCGIYADGTYVAGVNGSPIPVAIDADSNNNRITASTIVAPGDTAIGIYLWPTSSAAAARENTFSRDFISVPGGGSWGVGLSNSSGTVFSGTTILAGGGADAQGNMDLGMYVSGDATMIENSTVLGSTAIWISGSTATTIGGSFLTASASNGAALYVDYSGSDGLVVSTTVITGGALGEAVFVDGGSSGAMNFSSNTISGAQYGVYVDNPAPGAQVFFTSNTIVAEAPTSTTTYGMYLDGLANGATVQNNSIVYRTPGGAASLSSYALYVSNSKSLRIDHNRIDEPGMIVGGASFHAVGFAATTQTIFKFNDVNSTGTAFTNAYLLEMRDNSTADAVQENAFSSLFVVTGASATVLMDATSLGISDYNDYFSSNAAVFVKGGAPFYGLAAWQAATGLDMHSISVNPHWFDPSAGVEDFHPISEAGRWNAGAFVVTDSYTSALIDAGDVLEPYNLEPTPNGGRVNIGSYGDMNQASMSPSGPTTTAVAAVYASSVSVSYIAPVSAGAGIPSGYVVTASSAGGIVVSSSTLGSVTLLAPQGLLSNTTYTLVASAIWGDYVSSSGVTLTTVTLAYPPASAVSTFAFVAESSMSVSWSPVGNPLGVTTYTVVLSTSPNYPNAFADTTAPYSTAPAGTLPTATLTGLVPNTTYFAFASAVNWAGVATAYAPLGSTSTYANAPATAVTTFTPVTMSSFSVLWSANFNPLAITTYTVELSTAPDFNAWASSFTYSTAPVAGPCYTFTGLSAFTTYYLQIEAISNDGSTTGFVYLGSTQTAPVTLQPPTITSVLDVYTSSITAGWELTPLATGYTLVASLSASIPPSTVGVSSFPVGISATTASVTGLNPNTTYYLFVSASGPGKVTAYSAYAATSTLADVPTTAVSTSFASVNLTSMTVIWGNGGNPVNVTSYTVVLTTETFYPNSDVGTQAFSTAPAGATPAYTFTTLNDNTLYYAFVAAVNNDGVVTNYAALGSTVTPISPPAAVFFDEISSVSIVASAYAPTPLFSNLGAGQSGTHIAKQGAGYLAFHGEHWSTVASMPTARYFMGAASSGGKLYVAGGVSGGVVLSAFEMYDPSANLWTPLTGLPTPRTDLAAAASGGIVYALGGQLDVGGGGVTTDEQFDTDAGAWNTVAAAMPSAHFDLSAAAYGGKIYAIGGSAGGSSFGTAVEKYDPVADQWTTVASIASDGLAAAVVVASAPVPGSSVGSFIYVAGGNSFPMLAYNTAANSWNPGASIPALNNGVGGGSSVGGASLGGKVYVIGGPSGAAPVYEYDPTSNVWAARANMLTGRLDLGVSEAGGFIYAVGGSQDGVTALTTNEQYDPGVAEKVVGLTPNKQFFFKAQAVNQIGVVTPETAYFSTYTWAALPSTATPSILFVSPSSATFAWTADGNPSGTQYLAMASTAPNLGSGAPENLTSWMTSGPSGTISTATWGLTPNTTYFFWAKVRNAVNVETAFTIIGSTLTPAAVPTASTPTFDLVGTAAMTFSWLTNGNPVNVTSYSVVLSPNPILDLANVGDVFGSTAPTGPLPTATLTGLSADTTYYLFAAGVDFSGSTSAYVSLGAAATLAYPPAAAAPTFDAVWITSVTASWLNGGNPVSLTSYTVVLATSAIYQGGLADNVVLVGTTPVGALPTATIGGLIPNTTYFAFAAAYNTGGALTAYVSLDSVSTLAAPPLTGISTFSAVFETSMTVNWSANDNPLSFTTYTIVLSTAPDFNAGASSFTFSTAPAFGPGAGLTGLASNTSYYLEIEAIGNAGTPTGFTVLGATATAFAAPAAVGFQEVDSSSISVNWTFSNAATGYTLVAAVAPSDPPTAVGVSSSPVGATATTGTVTGLNPNTTYYLYVQAAGTSAATGLPAETDFAAFDATSTLANAPLTAVSTFDLVDIGSMTVIWNANLNPPGTLYVIVLSTAPDFNAFASSFTYSTSPLAGTSASLNGLSDTTTYYLEIQAINNNGVPTPFVAFGSTQTATPTFLPPVLAGLPSVGVTSITATWALVGSATGYTLIASTVATNPPSAVYSSSGPVGITATTATVSGLVPNTTYFLFLQADGPGLASHYAAYAATSTLAAAPAAPAGPVFGPVYESSMTVNWSPGGNPLSFTTYTVTLSVAADFDSLASSFTKKVLPAAAPSVQFTGLAVNATYYLEISALNHDGVASPYFLPGSTSTLAQPPLTVASTFSAVAFSSFTVSWNADGNPMSITNYIVELSTAPDFNAFATSITYSTTPAVGPSAVLTGLAPNTSYYLRIAAIANDGVASPFTSLGSTLTLAIPGFPFIGDAQPGDATWRFVNNGLYNVTFADFSTTHLQSFSVKASTTAGGLGTDLIPFTLVKTLSPLDSFSTPWQLPPAFFAALMQGVTNYITVEVSNGVPNTTVLQDAFYVLKDTVPPTLVDNQAGDAVVRTSPGTTYAVSAFDATSGLAGFQYSASLNQGLGDASLIPWTDVAAVANTDSFTTPWTLNFGALGSGVTNFISVRTWDAAGSTVTQVDAFYVLKDTVGPVVAISSPTNFSFTSVSPQILGTAGGPFPVKGTEVSVQQNPPFGNYWDPSVPAFVGAAPVWMPAAGTANWSLTPNFTLTDGTTYQIVARSSSTSNQYSTVYATASFYADLTPPSVGLLSPAGNANAMVLPAISGTALDASVPPGGAAAGIAFVQVRLRRQTDGMWWNWGSQTWGQVAVSTLAAGTTTWMVTPTPLLIANLAAGASYYVTAAATDFALPPNQGQFFVSGATFTWQDTTPPAAPANAVATTGYALGSINLTWTSPGEEGNSGIVLNGFYAVFYSTNPAAVASTAAAQVVFSTGMVFPGTLAGYTINSLNPGSTYYLRVALENSDGLWSSFSNQTSTVAAPAPFNAIEGHVVDLSTNGITGVEVDCWNSAGVEVQTTYTLADGSGTYALVGLLPGNYKIKVTWTVNGISSSLTQDGIPLGSAGVDFVLNINYSLATLTGSLGALTASAIDFAPAASGSLGVASYRGSAEYAGSHVELWQTGRQIAQVKVGGGGRWTIPHLLPGAYAVRAWTGLGYTQFQNVALNEGDVLDLEFAFDPLPAASVFAFPNPARTSTTIRFQTALWPLQADIDIFDVAGNLVREITGSAISQLRDPTTGNPDLYHAEWDLTNSRGRTVASGVYIVMVKVKGGSGNQVAKVIKKLAVIR